MTTPHRTVSTFRARYAETDQMGVIYHSHYLVWCEIGRTDFLRSLGRTYAELEREGVYLAVTEARIRFLAPARYDEEIRVETWIERVQSRAVTFGYEIGRAAPSPPARLALATTTLVALDARGTPMRLPPDLLQLLRDAATPSP
ncbi:MAG TPA: thioesterase family protein [Longimicrobiales bacterium]